MREPAAEAAFEIAKLAPSVLLVRFNRLAERNPLSSTTLKGLKSNLPRWFASDEIKSIIFTGTADVFASGANIRELAQLDSAAARDFAELGQNALQSVAQAPQQTIAAINGYCIGGGFDLALACDMRLASPSATFVHPGARLGIITGWGGTQRLPRLIGRSRALEMFVAAKTLNAHDALRIGLIDQVADSVLETALRLALLHCNDFARILRS